MIDIFSRKAAQPAAKYPYAEGLPRTRETIAGTLTAADPVMADVVEHMLQSGGKNIRASLLLAAAIDPDGNVPSDAVIAAAALEILHLATLVHDDVVDEAPTRRGRPSVQGQFGKKVAVLGGDYLFCVCFSLIAGITARYPDKFSAFSQAMTRICAGELRQYRYNGDVGLTLASYLRTIAGKTATLFSLAMYSGSILGGDDEKAARLMGRVGYQIGMLFQIADDCLDYESTSDVLKKTVKHDLPEGVITLPLILALRKDPNLREIVREVAGRSDPASLAKNSRITEQVCRCGATADSWKVAERYAAKARRLISQYPEAGKRELLLSLLTSIESRIH